MLGAERSEGATDQSLLVDRQVRDAPVGGSRTRPARTFGRTRGRPRESHVLVAIGDPQPCVHDLEHTVDVIPQILEPRQQSTLVIDPPALREPLGAPNDDTVSASERVSRRRSGRGARPGAKGPPRDGSSFGRWSSANAGRQFRLLSRHRTLGGRSPTTPERGGRRRCRHRRSRPGTRGSPGRCPPAIGTTRPST